MSGVETIVNVKWQFSQHFESNFLDVGNNDIKSEIVTSHLYAQVYYHEYFIFRFFLSYAHTQVRTVNQHHVLLQRNKGAFFLNTTTELYK